LGAEVFVGVFVLVLLTIACGWALCLGFGRCGGDHLDDR
jgi:hypothetical protein